MNRGAAWKGTIWEDDAWLTHHPGGHVCLKQYGLGIFTWLLGSCASWVAKKILPMTFEKNLEHLLESLKAWHKQHGDKRHKMIGRLTKGMVEGKPFPKLHAKASEVRAVLPAMEAYFRDLVQQEAHVRDVDLLAMAQLLTTSVQMERTLEAHRGFKVNKAKALEFQELVHQHNKQTTILCKRLHDRGEMYFNFLIKHHMLYHIADLGLHMSPKLGWCFKGEDMMLKVKDMAIGSFRGLEPAKLGNKVAEKYLVALDLVLSRVGET